MPREPESLLPLVPYLRRYASMLVGSKEGGDRQICLCLEVVAAEPERLEGLDLRTELFRVFHWVNRAIESIEPQWSGLTGCFHQQVKNAVGLLPLAERQAILLFGVEEFTLEQTAHILDLKVDKVRRLLGTARRELEKIVGSSVLIIEDEPLIALQLNALTTGMGFSSARLVGGTKEAVTAAEDERPDLVIADLQLDGGGSGIQAAREILRNRPVPIVFVTGYPEQLETELAVGPAFVVTKPFTSRQLKTVVDQAIATYASPMRAAAHSDALLATLDRLAA